jgi:hypothetical protein
VLEQVLHDFDMRSGPIDGRPRPLPFG